MNYQNPPYNPPQMVIPSHYRMPQMETPKPQAGPPQVKTSEQHLFVQDVLRQQHFIYKNRHGKTIFVDRTTGQATNPDDEQIKNNLMLILHQTYQTNPSRSAINNAIDVCKGDFNVDFTSDPLFQRIASREQAVWIICARKRGAWYITDTQRPSWMPFPDGSSNPLIGPPPHMPPPYHRSPEELEILDANPNRKKANFDDLFEVTNIPPKYKNLIAAWLVLSLLPRRRQVLLEFTGPSGTGKSHAQKTLRHLIDPNVCVIDNPTKPQHIHAKLMNSYVLLLDRVERLDTASQQLLTECLDTHAYAEKPNQKGHTRIDITRTAMTSSIDTVITDNALERRTISLSLDNIADHEKLVKLPSSPSDAPPPELEPIFLKILDLTHIVLKEWNKQWYGLPVPEELDDFIHVGCIIGAYLSETRIQNRHENPFIQEMEQYQHERTMQRLHKNPVASAIYWWVESSEGRTDEKSVGSWHKYLKQFTPDPHNWPANAHQMGRRLDEAKLLLQDVGIYIERTGKKTYVHWKIGPSELYETEQEKS